MSLTLLNVIDDPAIAINLQSNILRTRKNKNTCTLHSVLTPIKQLNTYLVPMQALCVVLWLAWWINLIDSSGLIPEPTARILIPPGYLHPGKRKH